MFHVKSDVFSNVKILFVCLVGNGKCKHRLAYGKTPQGIFNWAQITRTPTMQMLTVAS